MSRFCTTKFWDWNLAWYSDTFPDFTLCFEETVLVWIPTIVLIVLSVIELAMVGNGKKSELPLPHTIYSLTKTSLAIVLAFFSLIELIVKIFDENQTIFMAENLSLLIRLVSFLYVSLILHLYRKYRVYCSGALFFFWFSYAIGATFNYRSILSMVYGQSRKIEPSIDGHVFVIRMISYPIVIVELILTCFADNGSQHSEQELKQKNNSYPEERASFLSRITFNWFNPLIWKGYKKPLTTHHMWELIPQYKTNYVFKTFNDIWIEKLQRNKEEVQKKSPKGESVVTNVNVFVVILKMFWTQFISLALIKLIGSLIQFVNPLVLDQLISFLNPNNSDPSWRGVFYALIMLGAPVIGCILNTQFEYYNKIIGMKIRSSLISSIYKKSLLLSTSGRKNYTMGEITSIMSSDIRRVLQVLQIWHFFWLCPIEIAVAIILLWQQLGIASLSGMAFMFILMPMNLLIGRINKNIFANIMKTKDKRVKLINEILNGIKVFKLYAWETSFRDQVFSVRKTEVNYLKRMTYFNAFMTFSLNVAPFLVGLLSFGTFVLISSDNILDANKAFVSLSLFNILRFPLAQLPSLITWSAMSLVSLKRINGFLNSEEIDETSVSHKQNKEFPIVIEKASFKWTKESQPVLKDINLNIENNQLVAIVGQVGAGKSSLLSAILGELEKISGSVNVFGRIAYVSQQAWIQNSTLRQNILFTNDYNERLYNKVIKRCALEPDLQVLSAGDLTEIGEKGINLSGGQKQRVSLARAVYSNADIYLMDDPLSAVDSHVSRHLFDKVIGPKGMLSHKTRVLVTHRASVLPYVDHIVVIKDGMISESGSFEELIANKGDFAEFVAEYVVLQSETDIPEEELEIMSELKEKVRPLISRNISVVSEKSDESVVRKRHSFRSTSSTSTSRSVDKTEKYKMIKDKQQEKGTGRLIEEEKEETGSVKFEVYKNYFRIIGYPLIAYVMFSYILSNSATVFNGLWLSQWANDALNPNTYNDTSLRNLRLGVYAGIGFVEAIFLLSANTLTSVAAIVAAKHLHNNMLTNVLKSPMSFFDTTPIGRILNRFNYDVDTTDFTLQFSVRSGFLNVFKTIVTFIMITLETPLILIALLPLTILYYIIQRFYIATSRQLQRLESKTRSPIYNHFSETVNGSSSIRAFGVTKEFEEESNQRVDLNHKCYYPIITTMCWLSIRVQTIGFFIVFFTALFAVLSKNNISPGIAGLAISYAMNITEILGFLVIIFTQLETDIVAVERIVEYTNTPTESYCEDEVNKPPLEWPQRGSIKFDNYSTRYREGLDLILKGLCFEVKPNEKVGVVGRTGAGKSSLTLALFRIIEPADGTIFIDGVDIKNIGLYELRSRLTIIPQDPALFTGTLRMNLDPFDNYSDMEIWRALESAHLKEFVDSLEKGLNFEISEGGQNLSAGQKQLVCLSRAILRRTKILVLDEATAAVDMETDHLIQETIRKEFSMSTIVTIAHRLNTILDYDRVVVMDKGMVCEYDTPQRLLSNTDSIFYGLAKDSDLVSKQQ